MHSFHYLIGKSYIDKHCFLLVFINVVTETLDSYLNEWCKFSRETVGRGPQGIL